MFKRYRYSKAISYLRSDWTKEMNKALKITLISLLSLIAVAAIFAVATNYVFDIFTESFSAECEETDKEWKIDNYKIQEYECLGVAGGYYYPFYLFKDDKFIIGNGSKEDSCNIVFRFRDGLKLRFDICENQIYEEERLYKGEYNQDQIK